MRLRFDRWLLACALVFSAGAEAATVHVAGAPRAEVTEGRKRARGYTASAHQPVAVQATGPGRMLVRALGIGRDDQLTITLERDGQARSVNVRPLVPSTDSFRGAPLSRPINVEVDVPAGPHDYKVTFSGSAFVQVESTRSRHAEWAAAAEKPMATAPLTPPVTLAPEPMVRTVDAHVADAPPPVVAPEPVAAIAASEPAAPVAAEKAVFLLTPVVGMGFVVEDALGVATPQFVFGADARYFLSRKPNGDMGLNLTLRDHASNQSYLTTRPDLSTGGAASLTTNEEMLQADLDFVYDFHPADRLWLGVFAGPGFRFFMNDVIPANIGGIYPGGELRFGITDSLEVRARVSYLYNLFFQNAGSLSAMGPPHAAADGSAGLALEMGGGNRLRLEYEGEDDAFGSSYRYYHSLCFLLDLAI